MILLRNQYCSWNFRLVQERLELFKFSDENVSLCKRKVSLAERSDVKLLNLGWKTSNLIKTATAFTHDASEFQSGDTFSDRQKRIDQAYC